MRSDRVKIPVSEQPSLFSNLTKKKKKKKTFNSLGSHTLRRRALLFSYICVTVLLASWLIVFCVLINSTSGKNSRTLTPPSQRF